MLPTTINSAVAGASKDASHLWRSILTAFLVGICINAISGTVVGAKEVCVTCQQPKMNYRCRVPNLDIGRASDAAQSYLCITALAKSGGHSECQIQRNPKEFSCLGQIRILDPKGKILDQKGDVVDHTGKADDSTSKSSVSPDSAPGRQDVAAEKNSAGSVDGTKANPEQDKQNAAKPKPKGPPKTVEELALDTAEKSKNGLSKAGEAIQNAGSAVGNAAKKSWECIASFFADC